MHSVFRKLQEFYNHDTVYTEHRENFPNISCNLSDDLVYFSFRLITPNMPDKRYKRSIRNVIKCAYKNAIPAVKGPAERMQFRLVTGVSHAIMDTFERR